MGVRESKVEKYLDEQVKLVGGITRKWVSPGRDGVPDRIVIIKGHVYFIEVKTVDGSLSSCQVREHERLSGYGAKVLTLYGVDDVDWFIMEIKLWTY